MTRSIPDIQWTPGLEQPVLVRETNDRFRQASVDLALMSSDIRILAILARIKTYVVEYKNLQTSELMVASAELLVEQIRLSAPNSNVTVEPRIDGVPIVFDPVGPFAVTATPTTHIAVSANELPTGSTLELYTTAGVNNEEVKATVLFSILGLSSNSRAYALSGANDDPASRAAAMQLAP